MIELDYRRGSGELEKYFQPYGISVRKCPLPCCDIAWKGHGATGTNYIGIERKRISDLIQSMREKRLAGSQLRGIVETFDVAYLLVEGIWRPGASGEVLIQNGRGWVAQGMMSEAIDNHVMSLAIRGGMIPWRTASPEETVSFAVHQYNSWQKAWSEHTSHDQIYVPQVPRGAANFFRPANLRVVTKREEFAYGILPGLGDDKARWAAKHFPSIWEMCAASIEGWSEMKWQTSRGKSGGGKARKLGVEVARKIVDTIRSSK